MIVIVGIIVCIIVVLQFRSFMATKHRIQEFKEFFPDDAELALISASVTRDLLNDKDKLKIFVFNASKGTPNSLAYDNEDKESMDVELVSVKNESKKDYGLTKVVRRTNEYLCKNIGTSADFNVLSGICDRQIDVQKDAIHSSLNVPLYLGLAGTFIGIITGLVGLKVDNNDMAGYQNLINGVWIAMSASLAGLIMVIINSAVFYPKAISVTNNRKEDYFDFIRRELMPTLSSSMSSSLNSLKGVLGHFVDKFGKNLDSYADSAALLNENLDKQHLVLQEINNLSLTRTATKIAQTFSSLKEAADSLDVFKKYQDMLNMTVSGLTDATVRINSLIAKFENFSAALSIVAENQNVASDLQKEFKSAIETHFPTGSDARDIWRKEFDELMEDAKKVSDEMSRQLTVSTEHIRNFVSSNNSFFETFNNLNTLVENLAEYTKVQANCYKDMKSEILNLRKDYKESQIESIELHKKLINTIHSINRQKEEVDNVREKQ